MKFPFLYEVPANQLTLDCKLAARGAVCTLRARGQDSERLRPAVYSHAGPAQL